MSPKTYASLTRIPLHSFRLSNQRIVADDKHVVIFNNDKRFELVRGYWKENTKVGI
jgi:hypothetical protein